MRGHEIQLATCFRALPATGRKTRRDYTGIAGTAAPLYAEPKPAGTDTDTDKHLSRRCDGVGKTARVNPQGICTFAYGT